MDAWYSAVISASTNVNSFFSLDYDDGDKETIGILAMKCRPCVVTEESEEKYSDSSEDDKISVADDVISDEQLLQQQEPINNSVLLACYHKLQMEQDNMDVEIYDKESHVFDFQYCATFLKLINGMLTTNKRRSMMNKIILWVKTKKVFFLLYFCREKIFRMFTSTY